MPLGSLRDQVIYPDTGADMAERGLTDAGLQQLLNQVHLPDLVAREGGWNVINNWNGTCVSMFELGDLSLSPMQENSD
jgi:ABC-type uncharacterized transport system fused permease/ATPase subunit